MTYESIHGSVSELYDRDRCWDELVTVGDRESVNIAEEALGRHGDSHETGLRLRDFETGANETYSFAELDTAANRVATYLEATVGSRDRVAAMLPAQIELYAAAYGTIKSGRVYVPLAPLFGDEALQYRLADSGASVLVTSSEHVSKLDGEALPELETVIVVDGTDGLDPDDRPADVALESYDVIERADGDFQSVESHPSDVYAIKYTSGTTGQPKGCPSTHEGTIHLHAYLEYVVDLQPEDNYFVAASPAWSYGFTAGTLAADCAVPLLAVTAGRSIPSSCWRPSRTSRSRTRCYRRRDFVSSGRRPLRPTSTRSTFEYSSPPASRWTRRPSIGVRTHWGPAPRRLRADRIGNGRRQFRVSRLGGQGR